MRRFQLLRLRFAVAVAAIALVVGVVLWGAKKLFGIDPGKGTPIGLCVRTDTHVATWIQTLESYVPSLHRDAGKDRYSLAVWLAPLDGGEPRLVPVHQGLTATRCALARILGADGQRLWVEAGDVAAIDLRSFAVDLAPGAAPARLVGSPTGRMQPDPQDCFAAGYVLGERQWLGLLAPEEARAYGPSKFVRRVVSADGGRLQRGFHRAEVEADSSGTHLRITSIRAIDGPQYTGAAFLRPDRDAEPLRLPDPAGAIMLFTTGTVLTGTLVVARTTDAGELLWRLDTGLDRFALQQVLPGDTVTAFVGTRPRETGRVAEPLLVLVDHSAGTQVAHSLWR